MNEVDDESIKNISTTPSTIFDNVTQSLLVSNSTPDTQGRLLI